MNLLALLFTILIYGVAGCSDGQKKEESKAARLAKMIPDNYFDRSDSSLRFSRDTIYFKDELFSGYIVERDISGDTVLVGSYFYGVEEGRHVKWYPGGQMMEERFFINGGKEGLHRGWWPDGKLKFRFQCYNNELDGPFEEWAQNGMRIKYFNFKNGYEEGSQRLWWDNGNIRANYVIRDGKKFGFIGVELCANPYDSVNKK